MLSLSSVARIFRWIAGAAMMVHMTCQMPALAMPAGEAPDKPNVLLIIVDDLRPQLACYGREQMITPNIDRLAAEGLLFERAYCQQAICSPSRISLLTGLRCETTGIYGLKTRKKDKLPDITSLPRLFKENGYRTLSIGKIYHHKNDDPEAWSEPPYRAMQGSGYVTAAAREIVVINTEADTEAGTKGPVTEAAEVPDNVYSDGKLTEKAIGELNQLDNRPFFLAVGYRKPHLPFTAPQRYWDLYDPQKLELARNPFIPEGATPYTMNNYGELRKYYQMPKGNARVDDRLARHLIHGYYACVSFIDAQIGKLLDALERLDLRKNTVIVLIGDHGWKLGEHDSWCKHTNFELDCNAPLIISDPRMERKGIRTRALAEFIDIYPTLCELADLPQPPHLEGFSFRSLMEDPDLPWKSAAFSIWVHGRYREKSEEQIIGYAMRTDRYRYIEWRNTQTGEIMATELYDHQSDPDENVNLADKPGFHGTVDKLHALMQRDRSQFLPAD
jgi:arylsulfatase A-like enzyme